MSAFFRNGEMLDRSDREALAMMKKLGFPSDYLEFMIQFGRGEFVNPLLDLWDPTSVSKEVLKVDMSKSRLTFSMVEPVQIGSFQSGPIMAVNHVGAVLFEYWPRVETEPRPVFTSLESLLSGLKTLQQGQETPRVYAQVYVPTCSLKKTPSDEHPPKQSDAVIKEIVALSALDDFIFLPDPEALEMFSEKHGLSVVFNGGYSVTLKFRYDAKLKKIVEVLAKHGWQLDRDPMNIHLRLLEEEI